MGVDTRAPVPPFTYIDCRCFKPQSVEDIETILEWTASGAIVNLRPTENPEMTMTIRGTIALATVGLMSGFATTVQGQELHTGFGETAVLTVIGVEIDGARALIFRVPYKEGSRDFNLSANAQNAIAAFAKRAEKVRVIAGVDDAGVAQDLVSIERAGAAREFLQRQGVAANRIEIAGPAVPTTHIDIVAVLPAIGASGSSK
jgi:hypothetical protein